jgi:hypothetical protein
LTVYRPTIPQGIHTCYQQQMNAIKNKGIINPNPRQQLLDNLITEINKFNNANKKTFITIDANEGLFTRNSNLWLFLAQTDMVSLVQHPQHYPPTHIRGTRCIDFILGTKSLQQHIMQSGITSLYESPWIHTDHRGIFIDINEMGLFAANTHHLIPQTIKRISS